MIVSSFSAIHYSDCPSAKSYKIVSLILRSYSSVLFPGGLISRSYSRLCFQNFGINPKCNLIDVIPFQLIPSYNIFCFIPFGSIPFGVIVAHHIKFVSHKVTTQIFRQKFLTVGNNKFKLNFAGHQSKKRYGLSQVQILTQS